MTAILTTATWLPHPGRAAEALANLSKSKKIFERLGGKVRIVVSSFGGTPSSLGYIVETASWTDFGVLSDKLAADAEWQSFWAGETANPSAELVQQSIVTELDV